MKKRLLYFIFAILVLCMSGCSKIDEEKSISEMKTEDLDEATLTGMAEDITKEMSLENKIGQLFMVSLSSLDSSESGQTKVTSKMKKTLNQYPVGGVVLLSRNIETKKQTKTLISDLQSTSYVPLFVAVDEEGGDVSRVASNEEMGLTQYPSANEIGETYSTDEIEEMGVTQSKELKSLGINMNFAPVADVLTQDKNTEIGNRSFGSDVDKVSDIVGTLVENMQKQQLSATLKHFPGSGDTTGDTHCSDVISTQSIQDLRKRELKPFEKGIDESVDCIMVSHLIYTNIQDDKAPASLSSRIVTDVLRDELGYTGLILTDAFNMKAITNNYDAAEAAVAAIAAGDDVIVMPENLKKAYKAVLQAVEDGKIKESRIDESVKRVIYTKIKRGTIQPDTTLLEEN